MGSSLQDEYATEDVIYEANLKKETFALFILATYVNLYWLCELFLEIYISSMYIYSQLTKMSFVIHEDMVMVNPQIMQQNSISGSLRYCSFLSPWLPIFKVILF